MASSILLAGVQALDGELGGLRARILFQRDAGISAVLCFAETCLDPGLQDRAVQPVDLFSVRVCFMMMNYAQVKELTGLHFTGIVPAMILVTNKMYSLIDFDFYENGTLHMWITLNPAVSLTRQHKKSCY